MARKHVLFLCNDNAILSLMAEAYLDHAGRSHYRAWSAGLVPAQEIDSLVLDVLAQCGVRARGLESKSWQVFADASAPSLDIIVNMAGESGRTLPLDSEAKRHEWLPPALFPAGTFAGNRRSDIIALFAEIRQFVDSVLIRPAMMWPAKRKPVLASARYS